MAEKFYRMISDKAEKSAEILFISIGMILALPGILIGNIICIIISLGGDIIEHR